MNQGHNLNLCHFDKQALYLKASVYLDFSNDPDSQNVLRCWAVITLDFATRKTSQLIRKQSHRLPFGDVQAFSKGAPSLWRYHEKEARRCLLFQTMQLNSKISAIFGTCERRKGCDDILWGIERSYTPDFVDVATSRPSFQIGRSSQAMWLGPTRRWKLGTTIRSLSGFQKCAQISTAFPSMTIGALCNEGSVCRELSNSQTFPSDLDFFFVDLKEYRKFSFPHSPGNLEGLITNRRHSPKLSGK